MTALKRDDSGWTAKVVFATRPESHPADEEWMADTIFSLFQQGVLKGFSVGFTVKESRPANDRDLTAFGAGCRRVISKWNLMELSVAPLPCNQEAVALAVSKGMLSPATAKGVWGVDAKSEGSGMAKCSECGKEYAINDMGESDGIYTCAACTGKSAPVKHVRRAVEFTAPAIVPAAVKRVHRIIDVGGPAKTPDAAVVVKRLVVKEVAKARGRIYMD